MFFIKYPKLSIALPACFRDKNISCLISIWVRREEFYIETSE